MIFGIGIMQSDINSSKKDQLVIISDKIPLSKIDSSITEVLYSHPFSLIASVTSLSCIFVLSDIFIETKQYVIILDKDDVKERFQIPDINDILEILNMAFH